MEDDGVKKTKQVRNRANSAENYRAGTAKSARKLASLHFDPLEKLVNMYRKLEREVKYWEDARERAGVVDVDAKGKKFAKPKYQAIAHMACYVQLEKIASQLTRYKYGRVPEVADLGAPIAPMRVFMGGQEVAFIDRGAVEDAVFSRDDDNEEAFEGITYESSAEIQFPSEEFSIRPLQEGAQVEIEASIEASIEAPETPQRKIQASQIKIPSKAS